jgi:hypothetical protein
VQVRTQVPAEAIQSLQGIASGGGKADVRRAAAAFCATLKKAPQEPKGTEAHVLRINPIIYAVSAASTPWLSWGSSFLLWLIAVSIGAAAYIKYGILSVPLPFPSLAVGTAVVAAPLLVFARCGICL